MKGSSGKMIASVVRVLRDGPVGCFVCRVQDGEDKPFMGLNPFRYRGKLSGSFELNDLPQLQGLIADIRSWNEESVRELLQSPGKKEYEVMFWSFEPIHPVIQDVQVGNVRIPLLRGSRGEVYFYVKSGAPGATEYTTMIPFDALADLESALALAE